MFIINYTLFAPTQAVQLNSNTVQFYLDNSVRPTLDSLGYVPISSTWGEHKIASKRHFHLMVAVDTKDAKTYKALAHKLRSLEPETDFIVKRSITLDSDKSFDLGKIGYPWKEMDDFMLALAQSSDLDMVVAKVAFDSATKKWKEVLAKKEKDKEEGGKLEKLYEYLRVQLFLQGGFEANRLIEVGLNRELMELTVQLICEWKKREFHKGNTKSLGHKQLSAQVVSYLYFHGYIGIDSILNLVHF